eukprot:SAG31_NODE_29589_length_392_cov_4.870307_1_plen_54_part_10
MHDLEVQRSLVALPPIATASIGMHRSQQQSLITQVTEERTLCSGADMERRPAAA